MKFKSDRDDEISGGNPFAALDKSTVLQETKLFNETPINSRRYCFLITNLIHFKVKIYSTLAKAHFFFKFVLDLEPLKTSYEILCGWIVVWDAVSDGSNSMMDHIRIIFLYFWMIHHKNKLCKSDWLVRTRVQHGQIRP